MGETDVEQWTGIGGSELGTNRIVPEGGELYAVARTPQARGARQGPKAGGGDVVAEVDAALAEYVRTMRRDAIYVIGPGSTMAALKDRLGGGTLLGVDLAVDGRIVARDVGEREIVARLAQAGALQRFEFS